MDKIIMCVNYVIDSLILLYMVYFGVFVLIGLFTRQNKEYKNPDNKFTVIIPAHNEEKVISKLINNVKKLDYPQHLYDVFVVADNCHDKTEEIARELEVNVFKRYNKKKKGKGYALKFAFNKLGFLEGNSVYDAAVIFDADNLVQDNFLQAMNTRLQNGEKIIQSYIDAKNPDDNWITGTFSMMFWINDRYNLLSRYNIGLSAVLMGTGMCISGKVINKIGWNTFSLTEDLEYSIQALGEGIKTTFARETKVFDEKPITFWASCCQRLRWARGQLAVVFNYVPDLLKKGFKRGSLPMIDGGCRLFQLPFIMFYFMVALLRIFFPDVFHSPLLQLVYSNIGFFNYILPFLPFVLPISVFAIDNLSLRTTRYIILFPVFMYSWVIILYWGLLTMNKKSWLPTHHSRGISMDKVKGTTGK